MGKFAIECPSCGKYVVAYNGLRGLIQNRIECTCGKKIDVRAERMTATVCPECKNTFVYDQGKRNAKCPVCHHMVSTAEAVDNQKRYNFALKCPRCGCGVNLFEKPESGEYTCPVCDYHIDVEGELARAKMSNDMRLGPIRFNGSPNDLVWKSPIEDFYSGTQLVVQQSHQAIFCREGKPLDLFGPGTYTLETKSLPMMESVYRLPADDPRTVFHADVYFFSTATSEEIRWGTDSKIKIYDPKSGLSFGIGAYGSYRVRITNARKVFEKVVGTTNGLFADAPWEEVRDKQNGKAVKSRFSSRASTIKAFFGMEILTKIKSFLGAVIEDQQIDIFSITRHVDGIAGMLREKLNVEVMDAYGLTLDGFTIGNIGTPEDDPSDPDYKAFRDLKAVRNQGTIDVQKEMQNYRVKEQSIKVLGLEQQKKILEAQGSAEALRIQKQAEADAYQMQAGAEAAEMRMKGYTYQDETRRSIGLEAMKNGLGSNGGAGALGDIASLGMSLGAMGSVIGMTKDAIGATAPAAVEMGQSFSHAFSPQQGWTCACGQHVTVGRFCPNCGTRKPEPKPANQWNCACGQQNIKSKFCPNCGSPRPTPNTWDCKCGKKGIESKFCPECGAKRPESALSTWDCACGQKGITAKFCPECGAKRPVSSSTLWDCACGQKGIAAKFCPECGARRPSGDQ